MDMIFFNLGMAMASISTVLPVYIKNLGASNFEVGLIPAIASLGWGLPALLGAKIAEEYAVKRDLIVRVAFFERLPYLFIALISFFLANTNPRLSLYLVISLLAVSMFSMGFSTPSWVRMIEKVIDRNKRGAVLAIGTGVGAVAGAAGAAFVRHLLQNHGFPNGFGYSFLCAWIFFSISHIFLSLNREIPDRTVNGENFQIRNYFASIKTRLRNKNYRNYLIERTITFFGISVNSFAVIYLGKKLSLDDYRVAEFTALLLISQAISAFLLGFLGDKLGHKFSLIVGKIAQLFALFILLICDSLSKAYFVFLLFGVEYSSADVNGLALTMDLLSRKRKKELYIGIQNFILSLVSFTAPLIIGLLIDQFDYSFAFILASVFGLVSLVFLTVFITDPRKESN